MRPTSTPARTRFLRLAHPSARPVAHLTARQARQARLGLLLPLGAALALAAAPSHAQDAPPATAPAMAPATAPATTAATVVTANAAVAAPGAAAGAVAGAALNWTTYKGDAQRTSSRAVALPLPLNLLWRYSATSEAGATSPPIVVGEGEARRIFFSAGAAVFCINGDTGSIVWQSQVLTRPVTAPLVYVPGEDGGMIVAVTSGGQISALRTSDGGQLWLADAKSPIPLAAPVVARTAGGDRLIVALATGQLIAYTLDGTLDPKWRIDALNAQERVSVTATPALSKDGTRMFVPAQDQKLYSIDVAGSKVDFAITLPAAETSSPMVLDDQVVVSAGEAVIGYRLRTGDPIWRVNIGGQVSASPAGMVGADGKPVVYIGNRSGDFYAIDATKGGKVLWKRALGESVTGTASVTNNAVMVGTSRGVLFALKPADGSTVWQYRLRTERAVPNTNQNGNGFGRGGAGGGVGGGAGGGGRNGRGFGGGRFGVQQTQVYGVSAPPVIVGGQAYVMGDNVAVYCFDTRPFDSAPPRVIEPSLSVPAQDGSLSTQLLQEGRPLAVPGKAPMYFAAQIDDTGSGLDASTLQVQWNDTTLPAASVTYSPGTGVLTIVLNQKSATGTAANIPDGIYTIRVTGKDYAGNALEYSGRVSINNALPAPASAAQQPGFGRGRRNRGGGGTDGGGTDGGGFPGGGLPGGDGGGFPGGGFPGGGFPGGGFPGGANPQQ